MNHATLVGIRLVLGMASAFAITSLSAGTFYIDYSAGSDAAAGTAKATAWKRAPFMKSFGGSYSHAAGDRFIFKGGVIWPVSCFQMKITAGGSAGNPDQYTTDPTWYSGASYTRPIFDFQHTTVGPGWTYAAGVLVEGVSYVTFDGLDLPNFRAPLHAVGGVSTWGSAAICLNNASNFTLTNCIVRDWDQPTVTTAQGVEWFGGGAIIRVNSGTGNLVTDCVFHLDNVTQRTGTACWNIPIVQYSTFRSVPQCVMSAQLVHDNQFLDTPNPHYISGDPVPHANVIYCHDGLTCYNNLINGAGGIAQVIYGNPGFSGANTWLIYNNTVLNVAQPCIAIETEGSNSAGAQAKLYNNTLLGPGGGGYCIRTVPRGNGPVANVDYRNNHLITSGTPFSNEAGVTTLTTQSNLVQTVTQASAAGYTAAQVNPLSPIDATKPTVGTGTNLTAVFVTDRLGVARPSSGVWDIGSYQFATDAEASPGMIVLDSAIFSVSEAGGTVTLTVKRTGGTTGAVAVSWATANGTAASGTNYTGSTGTRTWVDGDATDKLIVVAILDADAYGSRDFTLTLSSPTGGATLGTPSAATITITGTGSPPPIYQTGLGPWDALGGEIAAPWTTNLGYLVQDSQTTDYTLAGKAVYRFTTTNSGTFSPYAYVRCVDGSANSFFISIDGGVPKLWDVLTYDPGFVLRYANDRGALGPDDPRPNWTVDLSSGAHTLELYAREAGAAVDQVGVELLTPPATPIVVLSVTSTNANGHLKAGDVLGVLVTLNTNATVAGAPLIALDIGNAEYASGSGTAALVFNRTITDPDTSSGVDYTATNSLTLNGGSIANGATAATLTLPAPGAPGSLGATSDIVVDTTAPTAAIGQASSAAISQGGSVSWTVTYADTNFFRSTLAAADVTLNTTGTATGTVSVSNDNQGPVQSVTVDGVSGVGTIGITVNPGKARDQAGNVDGGVGPSGTCGVNQTRTVRVPSVTAQSATFR